MTSNPKILPAEASSSSSIPNCILPAVSASPNQGPSTSKETLEVSPFFNDSTKESATGNVPLYRLTRKEKTSMLRQLLGMPHKEKTIAIARDIEALCKYVGQTIPKKVKQLLLTAPPSTTSMIERCAAPQETGKGPAKKNKRKDETTNQGPPLKIAKANAPAPSSAAANKEKKSKEPAPPPLELTTDPKNYKLKKFWLLSPGLINQQPDTVEDFFELQDMVSLCMHRNNVTVRARLEHAVSSLFIKQLARRLGQGFEVSETTAVTPSSVVVGDVWLNGIPRVITLGQGIFATPGKAVELAYSSCLTALCFMLVVPFEFVRIMQKKYDDSKNVEDLIDTIIYLCKERVNEMIVIGNEPQFIPLSMYQGSMSEMPERIIELWERYIHRLRHNGLRYWKENKHLFVPRDLLRPPSMNNFYEEYKPRFWEPPDTAKKPPMIFTAYFDFIEFVEQKADWSGFPPKPDTVSIFDYDVLDIDTKYCAAEFEVGLVPIIRNDYKPNIFPQDGFIIQNTMNIPLPLIDPIIILPVRDLLHRKARYYLELESENILEVVKSIGRCWDRHLVVKHRVDLEVYEGRQMWFQTVKLSFEGIPYFFLGATQKMSAPSARQAICAAAAQLLVQLANMMIIPREFCYILKLSSQNSTDWMKWVPIIVNACRTRFTSFEMLIRNSRFAPLASLESASLPLSSSVFPLAVCFYARMRNTGYLYWAKRQLIEVPYVLEIPKSRLRNRFFEFVPSSTTLDWSEMRSPLYAVDIFEDSELMKFDRMLAPWETVRKEKRDEFENDSLGMSWSDDPVPCRPRPAPILPAVVPAINLPARQPPPPVLPLPVAQQQEMMQPQQSSFCPVNFPPPFATQPPTVGPSFGQAGPIGPSSSGNGPMVVGPEILPTVRVMPLPIPNQARETGIPADPFQTTSKRTQPSPPASNSFNGDSSLAPSVSRSVENTTTSQYQMATNRQKMEKMLQNEYNRSYDSLSSGEISMTMRMVRCAAAMMNSDIVTKISSVSASPPPPVLRCQMWLNGYASWILVVAHHSSREIDLCPGAAWTLYRQFVKMAIVPPGLAQFVHNSEKRLPYVLDALRPLFDLLISMIKQYKEKKSAARISLLEDMRSLSLEEWQLKKIMLPTHLMPCQQESRKFPGIPCELMTSLEEDKFKKRIGQKVGHMLILEFPEARLVDEQGRDMEMEKTKRVEPEFKINNSLRRRNSQKDITDEKAGKSQDTRPRPPCAVSPSELREQGGKSSQNVSPGPLTIVEKADEERGPEAKVVDPDIDRPPEVMVDLPWQTAKRSLSFYAPNSPPAATTSIDNPSTQHDVITLDDEEDEYLD